MVEVKTVILNNKSRKGRYVYVKEKGKTGKYYKEKEGLAKESYAEIYKEGGLRQRKGGITKEKIERVRVLKSRNLRNIEENMRNGYAQTVIQRGERLTPFGIKTAYMNLLRNSGKVGDGKAIVRDKELLEILSRPEDVEKWKHRVSYKAEMLGEGGNIIGIATNKVPKSLGIVATELREMGIVGTEVGEGSKGIGEKMEGKEYNFERVGTGRIKSIKITMVFRKGR